MFTALADQEVAELGPEGRPVSPCESLTPKGQTLRNSLKKGSEGGHLLKSRHGVIFIVHNLGSQPRAKNRVAEGRAQNPHFDRLPGPVLVTA